MAQKSTDRVYLNKTDDVLPLPNLIDIQTESFNWFTSEGLA